MDSIGEGCGCTQRTIITEGPEESQKLRSSKEGLWQQRAREVPMDVAVFHISQIPHRKEESHAFTNPKTSFLRVSIRLEKTEWSFIGTHGKT